MGDRKFYLDFRSHLQFFAYRLPSFLRRCSSAMFPPASAILTLGVTSLIERDCSLCQMISHGLTNCNHTCTHRTYILRRPKTKLEESPGTAHLVRRHVSCADFRTTSHILISGGESAIPSNSTSCCGVPRCNINGILIISRGL